jgi:hypothetical protein
MAVTLVLTRNPLVEFHYGRMSGRWGQLLAIKGPTVTAAVILATAAPPPRSPGHQSVAIDGKTLHLSTDGEPIQEVRRYTTMERFRADSGNGYYVQLRPRTDPYAILFESGNPAVAKLRPDGKCFRVYGGKTAQERGILIHEAPNVSWVIGCIAPRPLGDFTIAFPNPRSNPSSLTMNELFDFAGKAQANFFVEDW